MFFNHTSQYSQATLIRLTPKLLARDCEKRGKGTTNYLYSKTFTSVFLNNDKNSCTRGLLLYPSDNQSEYPVITPSADYSTRYARHIIGTRGYLKVGLWLSSTHLTHSGQYQPNYPCR